MTNSKLQLLVLGVVIALAGFGMLYLTDPNIFGGGTLTRPLPDTTDRSSTPVIIETDNPHVKDLNIRINKLEKAEWDKSTYERLLSDIRGKRDAGLIPEEIATNLEGNLFNSYLITVKDAARKVITTSKNLRDLFPAHNELKKMKPKVSDRRVTEMTDMTHAIYSIPYRVDRLRDDIEAENITGEAIDAKARELAGKFDGFKSRYELFKQSPLVTVVREKGMTDLANVWGDAIKERTAQRYEDYVLKEAYEEEKTNLFLSELSDHESNRYLRKASSLQRWVSEQNQLLLDHRKAHKVYTTYEEFGGTKKCEQFERFTYYYDRCTTQVSSGSSN